VSGFDRLDSLGVVEGGGQEARCERIADAM
jgi:hypothetical protein